MPIIQPIRKILLKRISTTEWQVKEDRSRSRAAGFALGPLASHMAVERPFKGSGPGD